MHKNFRNQSVIKRQLKLAIQEDISHLIVDLTRVKEKQQQQQQQSIFCAILIIKTNIGVGFSL